jgi:hypothetical protein
MGGGGAGSHGGEYEDVFWDVLPWSLVEIDRLLEVLTAFISYPNSYTLNFTRIQVTFI